MNVMSSPIEFDAPNHDYHQLNADQQAAIQKVFQFLMSDEKELSVSGPAGTGKTHLMKFIMKHTLREYGQACRLLGLPHIEFEIELTATTNKAAEVLQSVTGFAARTIHSFLSLKVKENFKTGKSDIIRTDGWTVHHRKLIFIDEASMVDSVLHGHILAGTDKTCKVIYLGDHCQMAPVMEKISPVYRDTRNTALLNQPMRNAGQPALMALCQQLRTTVETLKFKPIQEVPGVIDYVGGASAYQFIEDTFMKQNSGARILVYSNNRVQQYNQYIRDMRGDPDTFVPGEILINNNAFMLQGNMIQVEQEIILDEVDTTIFTHDIDFEQPEITLEVYTIRFHLPGSSVSYTVQVPHHQECFADLLKYFSRTKNWERFYWLKKTYPDLRQRDACTVYKAQGSTYHTAFLDLTNIGSCTQNDQLARMLYVGASRATTRLVLFGELPARLFV